MKRLVAEKAIKEYSAISGTLFAVLECDDFEVKTFEDPDPF